VIRLATPADRDAVVQTVTEAFMGDPAWSFLLGEQYPWHAPLFAAVLFDVRVHSGTVWVNDEITTVAMWERPDRSDYTTANARQLWADFKTAIGPAAHTRLAAYDDALAAVAPSDPYWYLGVLATAPDRQGSGLATAVLAPVLQEADSRGISCCLETSTKINRAFYENRGFTEATDVDLDNGPPTWWLRRAPTAPRR
jgi:GNAT superfamily N-acetyltransferase